MNGGTGKIWFAILVIIIAIAVVIVVGMMQGGKTGGTTTTQPSTPGTPAPPTAPASTKAPKDYLPSAVAGFDVAGKNDAYTVSYPDEVSAAMIYFKPSAGSKFENKVEHLTIYVHFFKDAKSATSMASRFSALTTIERDVSGVKVKLNYKVDTGEFILFTQKDKVVAYAFVKPSAKATFLDSAVLQDAVILGFSMIKF